MANTAAPHRRQRSVPTRLLRVRVAAARELFRKPRLPDTRLPANPDDTRPAALAVGQSADQYSKLAFSAEQLTRRRLEHSGFGADALRPR